MDNWPTIVAIVIALSGGVFLLSRPLPVDYKNGEYRRHLTKVEKAALQRGEVVEKTHKAYQTVWKSYYDQGPLRIALDRSGKYTFTPHGRWQRLTKQGRLEADSYPKAVYPEASWRQYLANGQLDFAMYDLPTVFEGDSIVETRIVQFRYSNPLDTAYVQHMFSKGNKEVTPSTFSFDGAGRKLIPQEQMNNLLDLKR
ncbi:hypothetical protein [Hymenobacter sp. DG25A]|uniref:hypothetical protein n=1 Tax=Hymenobacter sp. DG25A TaxID=1385663 RepID=UPI000AEAAF58|nr:hypothetical protein [Hymenobacter sp. DG25A]